jgi:hypothetical protein
VVPDELRRRALQRALANGGARCVTRLRFGLYAVESASRPGTVHRVSVDEGGRYACSCPARLSGRPCWHAGAVFIAKVEAGGGRVTAPAAPGAGEPGADRELVLDALVATAA